MTNQNDQAKSLLDQVRKKNGRYMMSPYGPFGPTISPIGGGAFDEMIELYVAARKEDDQLKGQIALEQQQEKSRALSAKYQELQDELAKLRQSENYNKGVRETAINFLVHLLRPGDVVVHTYLNSHVRIKIVDRVYEGAEQTITYVDWDGRRKDWCKTSHTLTVEKFCFGYRIVTVERPEDKENTKKRKQKAKKD